MKLARGLLIMALAVLFSLPALGQNRIATIDLKKVFDSYYKRQEAQAAVQKRKTDFETELKGFEDDQKKLVDEYNKLLASANDQSVTPAEREKRKAAAQSKEMEVETSKNTIRTFAQNADEQLQLQVKRMLDNILQDIRTAVNAKAKTAGYTMVVDVSAQTMNQTPVILYSNGENDLTDAIIAQINIGAPPSSTTSTNDLTKPAPSPTGNK